MLLERQRHAQNEAARLLTSTSDLLQHTVALRADARRVRAASAAMRYEVQRARMQRTPRRCWFSVRGILDGRPTSARWVPGHLDSEAELLRRAEIVVALGESFSTERLPGRTVQASLEGPPIAVLLTIMRAFSAVTAVDICLEFFEPRDG